MTRLAELNPREIIALERQVQASTRGCATLEGAAQVFTSLLGQSFPDDVLLARLFVTVPYARLLTPQREFVDALAVKTGIADRITNDTLVLALAGTSGALPEWSDRRRSQGHIAIPLATSDFIDAIPMMSRLLRELGLGLEWIDSKDTSIVARSLGSSSGIFYVREASEETDNRGRKIIAAQEFVQSYGVKTVFGIGGAYMGTDSFLVNIVFCKSFVERASVEPLMGFINRFKASTMEVAKQGHVFVQ
jgi:hypothetical protein